MQFKWFQYQKWCKSNCATHVLTASPTLKGGKKTKKGYVFKKQENIPKDNKSKDKVLWGKKKTKQF